MTQPTLRVLGIYARADKPRQQDLPEFYTLQDLSPDQVMVRRRVPTTAKLIPVHGLVEHLFYHNDIVTHSECDLVDDPAFQAKKYPEEKHDRIFEERAVLIQSMEHYKHLSKASETSQYFSNPHECLDSPTFGEQLIVEGLDHSDICIGDVFEVNDKTQNDSKTLKLQVTSPRLPCAHVDKKIKSPFGINGVRRYTATHGLAGWFVRVLQAGNISDGTELVRTAHPHPKWTLQYISKALYGEGDSKSMLACTPQWTRRRSKQELIELCALPELGWYEWKAKAQWILDQWNDKDATTIQKTLAKLLGMVGCNPSPSVLASSGDFERNFSRTLAISLVLLTTVGVHIHWATILMTSL